MTEPPWCSVPPPGIQAAYTRLVHLLQELGPSVLAFSGGVDSTLLLYAARHALGAKVMAVTLATPYIPKAEVKAACALAAGLHVPHQVMELPFPQAIQENPRDRCYICKKYLFIPLVRLAEQQRLGTVIEGTQLDDLKDDRPGRRALQELGICSPLVVAGLDKQAVRELSRALGLPTWKKQAFACLLTRIPFGVRVEAEQLERIEQAEAFLTGLGFHEVRVRTHGRVARIEVASKDMLPLISNRTAYGIDERLKALGYEYVCLDLAGYRMGSLNVEQKEVCTGQGSAKDQVRASSRDGETR